MFVKFIYVKYKRYYSRLEEGRILWMLEMEFYVESGVCSIILIGSEEEGK